MHLTLETVNTIVRNKFDAKARANAMSVLSALDRYGRKFGLDQPHRLAQYLPQLMHESGEFRFDKEVWGPTPAQQRYDTRTDLGNTPERDGDGFKNRGRGGIQITGGANIKAFRDWCRANIDPNAPDFVANPDLINTDPWEGLGPIWYWHTRKLNRYADQGDPETITVKINGGKNGLADRLELYSRTALVLLGYAPTAVTQFQRHAQRQGWLPKDEPGEPSQVDGDAGPRTRAALHQALMSMTPGAAESSKTKTAPVVEEKPVAVTPPELDKPVEKTAGFWERIMQLVGLAGIGGASWLGDWRVILAIAGSLTVVAIVGLLLHARVVAAVRAIKQEIRS